MTDQRSSSPASCSNRGSALQRRPRFAVRPLALALAGASLLSLLPGMAGNAQAQANLPTGMTVIQGQVNAVTSGNKLTVTNSAGSILNWQGFSIGAGNAVTFVQPNAQSAVLNRVVGNDPSSILGSLSSNGRVWLLNPNGVIFGQGARIDVGGLVTSTLNLNDADWLAGQGSGRFKLFGDSTASIVNQGELRSSLGGHIALLGGSVRNEGLIEAPNGQILLAAGKSIELIDTGSPNLRLKVTAPDGEALNLGTLQAANGRIDVHGAVVNQQGIARVDSLTTNAAGEIVLSASQNLNLGKDSVTSASGATGGKITLDSGAAGTTLVSGAVLATGSAGAGAGAGGSITALGKNVGVVDNARLDASGSSAGGQIHVGGGERGQDAAFRNADGVYIGREASLAADATANGDGGKIVLWGNEATRAYGSFSARGGPQGGNGGFIETSGGWIDVNPVKIDATAVAGLAGTWLLDPYNIVITEDYSVSLASAPVVFTSTSDDTVVPASLVRSALNAGNNVLIATGAGGTQQGNISVAGEGVNLTVAPPTAVTLTLQAHGDIDLSGTTIASTAAPLSVDLQAGLSGSGYFNSYYGTVSTAGGSFSVNSASNITLYNTPVTTAGGNVSLRGNLSNDYGSGIYLSSSPIAAGAGTVTLNGTTSNGLGSGGEGGYPAGVTIDRSNISGRDISIVGLASSESSGQARGVDIYGGSLTATHALTITGTGETYGVNLDQATASVRPTGPDPTALLTVTGTSTSATARPSYDNYGVSIVGSGGDVLTATYGGSISITGNNNTTGRVDPVYGGAIAASPSLLLSNGTARGQNVTLTGNNSLQLSNYGGVVATGNVQVLSSNVSFSNANLSSTASGDAIVVAGVTGNTASFSSGATSLTTSNGRWLIYGTTPASTNASGLTYAFKQYNAVYGTPNALTPATGNGVLYSLAPTVIVGSEASFDRPYDGTTVTRMLGSTPLFAVSGLQSGDTLVRGRTGATGTFASKDVGSRAVSIAAGDIVFSDSAGHAVYGYGVASSITGNITQKLLSINLSVQNKVYDGTGTATYALSSTDVVSGDLVTFTPAQAPVFGNRNVGNYTLQATNISVGGRDGGNYAPSNSGAAGSASITPAPLTVTANNATKTYGTTLTFTGTEFTPAGLVNGETIGSVTLNSTGAPASASVAGGPYPIVASNTIGGSFRATNYSISYVNGTLTVNPSELNAVLASIVGNPTKAYDGGTVATLGGGNFALSGFVNGDSATVTKASGSYDNPNAGSRTVTTTLLSSDFLPGGATDLRNYTLPTSASGAGTITPKPVTLSGVTANNKPYDGNTTASLGSAGTLNGLVDGQTLTLNNTGARFDTASAGTGKTVTVGGISLTDGSGLASNYVLGATTASTKADITPAALTVTANNAVKTYGTALSFTGNEFSAAGLVGSETIGSVTLTSTGAPATASVAGGPYPIVASNASGGSFSAANYNISYVNGTLTVNPSELNAVLASIVGNPTKTYDGNTLATLAAANFGLSGFIGSDSATVSKTSGTYSSADAGSRTVTTTLVNADFTPVGSTDLRNYTLPTTASGAGTITQKQLTLTGVAANNKAYDGTTVASLSSTGTLGGLVSGQTLGTSNTGARFDTKDAGTGKTVTVGGITLSDGSGLASNYRVADTATTTADITPKTLTAGSISAANKVYDGNTTASITLGALNGLVGNETLGVSSDAARFDTKDAGTGKTVTVAGITLADGSGRAANYRVAATASTTADITPAVLTISANNASKTFGETLAFAGTEFTSTALIGTETITRVALVSAGTAATASVAGGPYDITASNATGSSGFDARNYDVRYVNGTLTVNPANLSPVLINITGNPTKVYDGTTVATLTSANFGLAGFVGSDSASITRTDGRYDSANAGGRTVTVNLARSDYAAAGSTDLRNYALPTVASGSGSIVPKPVTATGGVASNKVYDGNTNASVTGVALSGLVGTETLVVGSTSARFDTRDAGTGKTVTVTGLGLSNGSGLASNYVLSSTSASTTADITPASLTVTANNAAKTYGSTLNFSGSEFTAAGLVNAETIGRVNLTSSGAAAAASVAGGPYSIVASNATGGSFSASNYNISYVNGTLTVNPAELTAVLASIVGNPTKVYDGNTVATLSSANFGLTGFFGTDAATVSKTSGTYSSADAGSRSVSTTLVNGDFNAVGATDLRNYTLPTTASGAGTITPRTVTLVGVAANNKVYDGNTLATLASTGTLSGLVAGQTLGTTNTGASFDTKDAGSAKTVTLGGVTLTDGSGLAANYRVAPSATATAAITPANLTYTANPADTIVGAPLPALSGSVSGFVAGETLATATSGSLNFTTPATTASPAGSYAIDGGGLSAANYRFTQAPGNASALTVVGLPPAQTDNGSKSALNQSLETVRPQRQWSDPDEGRVLDVLQVLVGGYQGALFRSIATDGMSMDQLTTLLAARDTYKKTLFAESIKQLEANPALADVPPCQTADEAEAGTCAITAPIKAQLQERRAARVAELAAAAPAPAPAAPPANPAAPPAAAAAPTPPTTAPPPPPRVAAVTPEVQRLLSLSKRRVRTASLPQIERKIAVVIGIDRYNDKTMPQLDNAVRDARAIGQLLESKLGYEVIVLPDASKGSVIRTLNRLAVEAGPKDSVVVYYAGHGELVQATGLGYWQLADSGAKRPESWLSNSDISRLVRQIGASQVALVSDSCYSGSLVDERIKPAASTDPQTLLAQKTVVVMSSGGNEPVFDDNRQGHSPFAFNLMRQLQDVSTWQAGGNVFERVRFAVARTLPQRPRYGTSAGAGHQAGGDYLFEQRQLDAAP